MSTQSAINWPERYLPGFTDNFASNEIIVKGLSVAQAWPYLVDTSLWPTYYENVSDISFPGGGGPRLFPGAAFRFATLGFPALDSQVVEFEPPAEGKAARLSWTAKQDGSPEEQFDVLHAWLLEDLPGGRLRVLTQESQIGKPAAELAVRRPNPLLNAHQAWLDGLLRAARR